MPPVTLYQRNEDAAVWTRARELAGQRRMSMSAAVVAGLRLWIKHQERYYDLK